MYGYVVPKKDCLKNQDFVLYRAFYCGICKATGNLYGQLPRFTTNYDIVFLSVLLHDHLSQEVSFASGGCVLNPFQKKATVCRNGLMDKLIAANIILSYYKVHDDIADKEGSGKRAVKTILKKAYRQAAAFLPEAAAVVQSQYARLARMEAEESGNIDEVADCFASLLEGVARSILGSRADENVLRLCYNVGKFVYLADAIDDLADDFKKNRYNPFLAAYGGFKNRRQFIDEHRAELNFIFSITVNRAIERFNNMQFSQSYDLLTNIVHYGLREKVDQIFSSNKKLPKPKI